MTTNQTNQQANLNLAPRWARPCAIAAAIVFVISLGFPVTVSLAKNTASFPQWWGTLDVSLAFVLAILALVILALGQGRVTKDIEDASYRAYRLLIHGIFALMVVFLVFGDQIAWINGLPGLAWRAWLLLYVLPAWLAVLRPIRSDDVVQ
jgi:ABC-type uncharacterized transport system fused permease/ATPase subunit